ncbi:MAG: polysaccharide deacetylase family protein [Solirubrobacteraceae bacterium]
MRFSIIVPTHQRRAVVTRHVAALDRQVFRDFEVIVVVDGSSDGSAGALKNLSVGFPLKVLEQPNRGRAQACNAGAAVAGGELLLFLDDDMEAHPALLLEHQRSQLDGADVVLGDVPLHPDSPRNLLSGGVGLWASTRRERLSRPGAQIGIDDLLTGQTSIRRELFHGLGGFDSNFTRGGIFGGEDIDLGLRVWQARCTVVFNPDAISYQYYDVDPAEYLRRSRETGRAQQELVLKHPGRQELEEERPRFETRRSRWLLGPLVVAPAQVSEPLRRLVVALVRNGRQSPRTRRMFFAVRTMEHKRGLRLTRIAASRWRIAVLAYHAIADLGGDAVLWRYGVPAQRFAAQLDKLARHGWTFISLDDFLRAVAGEQTPPARSILVTFDDAYVCLLSTANPILEQRRIPAVAFAVAELVGLANDWDRRHGARVLQLLDAEGLRSISARGIEVGSHAATHTPLTKVSPDQLARELTGSAATLEALGLARPRALAYPHGEWDPAIASAAREAGYQAAFTVTPGTVRARADRWALPRIEVLAEDEPWRLRIKLVAAGAPNRWRGPLLALSQARRRTGPWRNRLRWLTPWCSTR